MATYSTEIDSTREREHAFDYLATFSNALEWDPSVTEAEALQPGPAEEGSVYRLGVRVAGRVVTFDYTVVALERPYRVVLQARHPLMTSRDTISVERCRVGLARPLRRRARATRRAPPGRVRWCRGPSPRWPTGVPPVSAVPWHEPVTSFRRGGHRARGDRRRQLQPRRVRRPLEDGALAPTGEPGRAGGGRDGCLVGDRRGRSPRGWRG